MQQVPDDCTNIVENGELSIQQSVIYDAGADEQNPWFTSVDDDWDVSNDTPTDEETAQAMIDSYMEQYAVLGLEPRLWTLSVLRLRWIPK